MTASKRKTMLKKRVFSILIILLFLLLNGGRDLRGTYSITSSLIFSLCLDAGNIVCIADMEHLDSGSGLLHNYHHLLIGIRSNERSGVYFTDEESFVLLLNLLGLFESADNLIES